MLPMGLTTRSNNAGYKPATLMEPKDDVEREERRGVLWYTVMSDIASSAMSGWGTSIVMDEVVSPSVAFDHWLIPFSRSLCPLARKSGNAG